MKETIRSVNLNYFVSQYILFVHVHLMDLYYTLLLSWPKNSIVISTTIHALNSTHYI